VSESIGSQEPAPLPTRERQRNQTRNLILRAAQAEIAAVGFSQARIGRIARTAGVTRPTIYAHFPTKEDFLRALQVRSEEVALAELRERVAHSSGADFVHELADAVFDLVDSADPVLRREIFALILREPPDANWTGQALFEFISELFGEAQTRGELRSGIPPADLTRLAVTAIFGFLVVESAESDFRRRAAHQMLDLLIRGAAS
jgi:AcrR family transcriptional regulator